MNTLAQQAASEIVKALPLSQKFEDTYKHYKTWCQYVGKDTECGWENPSGFRTRCKRMFEIHGIGKVEQGLLTKALKAILK